MSEEKPEWEPAYGITMFSLDAKGMMLVEEWRIHPDSHPHFRSELVRHLGEPCHQNLIQAEAAQVAAEHLHMTTYTKEVE